LFNSVQKFTFDVLGKVVAIFINYTLESIRPVDKDRFDHFDWETCQNFIHYFIFPVIFSPFKLDFQPTEKKKSDGAISVLYDGCGMRLNRETFYFSWVSLAV
jgi:hypothetical protein